MHGQSSVANGAPGRSLPAAVEVAIVGAGFGGLGAAIELERAGWRDFVVLERAPGIGGTWYVNSYPGCQCDVPSNLYSYSFARKPDWSRSYSRQPEILSYLRGCVERFGVGDRIHLDCEMREAVWQEEDRRWQIETSGGTLSGPPGGSPHAGAAPTPPCRRCKMRRGAPCGRSARRWWCRWQSPRSSPSC